jgi:hypothetical protein
VQVEEASEKVIETLYIKITKDDYTNDLLKLKTLATENSGTTSLILVFGEKPSQRALQLPFKISVNPGTRTELGDIFQKENLNFS